MQPGKSDPEAFLDRSAAIDWRAPKRDARGIVAAYQRWLARLGLALPVRLTADPFDVLPAVPGSGDWDAARRYFDAQIPNEATCLQLLQTGALRRYHPLG